MKINDLLGETPLNKINILVVDDDKRLLDLIKNVLVSFGFSKIEITSDGKQALKLIRINQYDLIITDWKMEPVSGYDIVYFIRNDPESTDSFIPIIMLSGMSERHHVEEARDVGVTEFLSKPFAVDTFRSRIVSIFEHPREFVFSGNYSGPSRRRQTQQTLHSEERRRDD